LQGTDLEIPVAVLKHLGRDATVNLFLASEVPPGTGLGSSAAVCVNVLKTLSVYFALELSNRQLAEAAFHIARDILKKPVGKQDEYAAAIGGLNVLRFHSNGVDVERVDLPAEMVLDLEQSLMLFFTGSSRDSSEILSNQDQSVRICDDSVVDALSALKELVPKMKEALVTGNLDQFGLLLDEGWRIKKRVSSKISSSLIDQVYEAALERGALGGKITGAGGGGFLLLFCEKSKQANVRAGLQEFGLKEMRFHFDFQGTRVVYNDPFFDSDSRGGMRWVFSPSLDELMATRV
jgi:D-glycero-alpha-D-manno-heptose-7-phosphate kinase